MDKEKRRNARTFIGHGLEKIHITYDHGDTVKSLCGNTLKGDFIKEKIPALKKSRLTGIGNFCATCVMSYLAKKRKKNKENKKQRTAPLQPHVREYNCVLYDDCLGKYAITGRHARESKRTDFNCFDCKRYKKHVRGT